MELRKRIFIICIVTSVLLAIDGVFILRQIFISESRNPHDSSNISHIEFSQEETSQRKYNPVNIVILGLDEEEVRSDVIVLLNFNPNDGRLNILSIARDTRVRARGRIEKINALIGMGGEGLAIKGVEQLTGLDIDYYLTLNFKGFRKIIDTLDGVEVRVPFDMNYDDPEQNLHIHLKKGSQLLDGKAAEQFVRYRKGNRNSQGYIDGDIGRIKSQQDFIKDMINQKVKLKYISKADDVYYILKKYMKTNIELSDINYYLKSIRNLNGEKIKSYTVPGDSAIIDDLWYFICDKKKTREMIDSNFFK